MHIDKIDSISITIKDIWKSFGKNVVLKGLNLDVRGGEFFTILGPSGCGKTTLLRIIAGFYTPDKGNIYFNKNEVTHLPPWEKNIGFVFQNYALWPNMNVFENIAYGLKIRKMSRGYIEKKVKQVLEIINLPGIEKQRPEELSGGMQQRVAIARVIAINPSLLLLDEPLSNLDAKLRVSLRKQIKEIQKELSITAIYVTHDQEEALEISDRIAVMNMGELQQVGKPEEVYDNPGNLFVAGFLGEANFIKGRINQSGEFIANDLSIRLKTKYSTSIEDITIIIRPEGLTVVGPQEDCHVEGKIVKRYYAGNLKKYLIKTINGRIFSFETFNDIGSVGLSVRLNFEKFYLIKE